MPSFSIHRLYHMFGRYFRTRRMQKFYDAFHLKPADRVLDVGGAPFNWMLMPEQPQLTLLNLAPLIDGNLPAAWIVADGRKLPFKTNAFEIVYSNSVIEHLGDLDSQEEFAAECRRVGRRYYVQTPNKWFPLEPHLLTPIIHWLPRHQRRWLLRYFTVWGWLTKPSPKQCDDLIMEIRLLGEKELKMLFPGAEIWHERFLGMTKSLIAVRRDAAGEKE